VVLKCFSGGRPAEPENFVAAGDKMRETLLRGGPRAYVLRASASWDASSSIVLAIVRMELN